MNAQLENPLPIQPSSMSPFIFRPAHSGDVLEAEKFLRRSPWECSEDTYWREQYRNEPYFDRIYGYADYLPAYRLGCENYAPEKSFDDVESHLEARWDAVRGNSRLRWNQARAATRSGWFRAKWISQFHGSGHMRLA